MADITIAKSALEPFISNANESVFIKLVKDVQELDDDESSFHPEFTHQLFGDSETIFGYRNLKVMLYYNAANLTTYLNMTYKEKVDPDLCDGVQADEVLGVISEKLQPGFHKNIDQFSASISKDKNFKPHGELIHLFNHNLKKNGQNQSSTFEIYKADVKVPGFQEYHERLQTFVLWYIDAASFIDIDDEKWCFYLMYEKFSSGDGSKYSIVGYSTIYEYYAYPQHIRPRISQMMILPPYQRNGLGAELLQAIYNSYIGNADIIDITVEDPSDNFVRLRDYVDVKNCLKLDAFTKDKLLSGFSDDMIEEAKEKFKLNKKQVRRVYEILRLHVTDMSNVEQYRQYRLEVKKRLNLPFQKEQSDMKKLEKTLTSEELKATLTTTSREQRLDQLDNNYKDLETEYRHILDRLAWD